LIAANTA